MTPENNLPCNQRIKDHLLQTKDANYLALHQLAELQPDELSCLSGECEIMDYALLKVIRNGSCKDLADAIKQYVGFSFAKQEISMLK